MPKQGLLINYEYCTGCHACEVACKKVNALPKGQFGIKVVQVGPWQADDDKWIFDFVPVLTDMCDLCVDRVAAGKWPSCVHHCQSLIIENGTEEALLEKAAALTTKHALFFPNQTG
jgi:Fe-S-cluster-containing dehydrogenase component